MTEVDHGAAKLARRARLEKNVVTTIAWTVAILGALALFCVVVIGYFIGEVFGHLR